MTAKNPTGKTLPKPDARQDRLKAALKANLARRKAQQRTKAQDKTGKPSAQG